MDWLRKLFNEPSTLVVIFSSGVVGLVVGFANGIIQKRHGGWSGFWGALLTGVAVAVIVGLGVKNYIESETLRLAIIGVCTVVSDDIWAGLKTLGAGLRNDPLGTVVRIFDAIRARPSTPKE